MNKEILLHQTFIQNPNSLKHRRGKLQRLCFHTDVFAKEVDDNFTDLSGELFHIVGEFAHHRNQKLTERRNQVFHVGIPILLVL